MGGGSNPGSAGLERLVEVVADRLRHLSRARLSGVEQQVRPLVAELAALALQVEGEPDRPLPEPAARALGDQVDVLGHDLVAALTRRPSAEQAARAHTLLVRIRRVLP